MAFVLLIMIPFGIILSFDALEHEITGQCKDCIILPIIKGEDFR